MSSSAPQAIGRLLRRLAILGLVAALVALAREAAFRTVERHSASTPPAS